MCQETGPLCRDWCSFFDNRNLQWCGSCSTYISCFYGSLSYNQCAPGNVWDSLLGYCNHTSTTCTECVHSGRTPVDSPTPWYETTSSGSTETSSYTADYPQPFGKHLHLCNKSTLFCLKCCSIYYKFMYDINYLYLVRQISGSTSITNLNTCYG